MGKKSTRRKSKVVQSAKFTKLMQKKPTITRWVVVKGRLQQELTRQANTKSFDGFCVLEAGKLSFEHESIKSEIGIEDLTVFGQRMLEKGQAEQLTISEHTVTLQLAKTTIAILRRGLSAQSPKTHSIGHVKSKTPANPQVAPDVPPKTRPLGGRKQKSGIHIDTKRLSRSIPSMDGYQLLNIWKNAVRLLADPTKKFGHSSAQAMILAISKEWEKRTLSGSLDDHFMWPTTDVFRRSGKEEDRKYRDEGMLSYLEYKVGKEGEHSAYRQILLSRIFEHSLPPVFDKLYMAQWGPNGSAIRLHKMAHCLASFARNFKYQNHEKYDEAIHHWEQDLEYLHDKYYVGKFGFGWPSTQV